MALSVEALRYKPEGRGFDSRWGSFGFFSDLTLPAALRPWRIAYQEYFLESKGDR